MTAWQLAWELLKHCAHRRGGDQVYVVIHAAGVDLDRVDLEVDGFSWVGDDDRFCLIEASEVPA